MTRFDLINLNKTLIQVMVENNVDIKEIQYLPLIAEYKQMKKAHHNVGYIICYLGEKYNLSERGVYKVIGRLTSRIKTEWGYSTI